MNSLPLQELMIQFQDTYLRGSVHADGYFRYDYGWEQDHKEAWSTYEMIREDLKEHDWELNNELTIEHDTITGYISEIRTTDS